MDILSELEAVNNEITKKKIYYKSFRKGPSHIMHECDTRLISIIRNFIDLEEEEKEIVYQVISDEVAWSLLFLLSIW